MVVYGDLYFFLNALIDYLLLLSAARICGEVLHRGRLALAAVLGGGYALLTLFPGGEGLATPPGLLGAWGLLSAVAYGGGRQPVRCSLVFLAVSAALGGAVLALEQLTGLTVQLDVRLLLGMTAGCYALLSLPLRNAGRHGMRELTQVRLRLKDRQCRLTALLDSGNTLTDPLTGGAVLVVEGKALSPLFPPGSCPTRRELTDPIAALGQRRGDGLRWRLLPYRAVGVEQALLLAVRVDELAVDGRSLGPTLVALSPGPVSDGGSYQALLGCELI